MYTDNTLNKLRKPNGIVMPLIAIAIVLFYGYLAFAIDIMYMSYLKVELKGIASSCSLYVMRNLNKNNINNNNLAVNITTLINNYNNQYLNQNNDYYSIQVNPNKYEIVYNSNNPFDFSLRTYAYVVAPFKLMFLPALLFNSTNAQSINQINLEQSALTSSQPAKYINQSVDFNILPIAISNQEFMKWSQTNNFQSTYSIQLTNVNSSSPNTIFGSFVDLGSPSSTNSNNFQANINDIVNLLNNLNNGLNINTPLNTGDYLTGYNYNYLSQNNFNINTILNGIKTNTNYVFPVIASDPVYQNNKSTNQIIGFAYLNFQNITINQNYCTLTVKLNPSIILPNTSSLSFSNNNLINTVPFNYREYFANQPQVSNNGIVYTAVANSRSSQDYILRVN